MIFPLERKAGSGKHFVAHGCVVEEDCFDDGGLFEVGFAEVFVGIEVCVMSAALVVARVLDELEARKAGQLEGNVIGAVCSALGDGR